MLAHDVDDIVQWAQQLGVPAAKYRTPAEVLQGEHERARGLFAPLVLDERLKAEALVAPFQFRCTPLTPAARVPALGEMTHEPPS
jgi:crotonobetainyl-CoA:carnitine CoA-transferase CaiB-like acyl-CoA transferase